MVGNSNYRNQRTLETASTTTATAATGTTSAPGGAVVLGLCHTANILIEEGIPLIGDHHAVLLDIAACAGLTANGFQLPFQDIHGD